MAKTYLSLFILLALTVCSPVAWADFEAELADTGKKPAVSLAQTLLVRAQAGDADAQLKMGGRYFKGDGVTQDYAQAAKWFLMAAQQGQAQAQFNLGMMYATGQGVTQDHPVSVQWYRRAAVQGLALAQLNLGVAYATGQGILQDEAEAVKWLRLAAEQGEPQAQFNFGVMYANGQGISQDLVEAYRWAKLAATQGHETAKALLEDLSKRMTAEQITRADNLTENLADTQKKTQPPKPIAEAEVVSGGIYLQLGAFKSEDEAKISLKQIRKKLGNRGEPLSLYTANNWVRVHIGPYANQREARRNAVILKARLGISPMLKQY